MTISSLLLKITVFAVVLAAFCASAQDCGELDRAWVWNCQTLLDNWPLADDKYYGVDDACKWYGMTMLNDRVCKLMENDSCAVTIANAAGGFWLGVAGASGNELLPGASVMGWEIKKFVQDAINSCTSDNMVSAKQGYDSGTVCLSNTDDSSGCI